ncbi:hypothetical protein RN001_008558 [Aquatica leii]|uniref:Fibronectin type-III domain-containing protein n=1 Tax=Aquatica leii TaxID=1421715 RepID=A0AAN7SGW6_9COLE|nr:hypothetical protein RN001_008558 [Aquatica leii]
MLNFFICFSAISAAFGNNVSAVRNLMGEPDYRKVRLHWETELNGIPQNGYQVRFCELQTWGMQRCRNQKVTEQEDNNLPREDNFKSFDVEISNLRMATKYSFEVRAQKENGSREDRAEGDNSENIIVMPTKGFSARATQCLPQASVIEVSTGPYFRGRIAVEAADGERCALDGEPTSPRDTYTLKIDHEKCGSQVNETTVGTFVLVQENLPILTHSTRRFLVLCSFQPETLTVRAGISLPTNALGRGQSDAIAFEEGDNYMRRSRHLRPARLLQGPDALDKKDEIKQEARSTAKSIPIALLAVLMVLGIVGLVCAAVRCSTKRISKEMDNVSISSDSSTASYTTNADVEADAISTKDSTVNANHLV